MAESRYDRLLPSLKSFARSVFVNGGKSAYEVVHWWGALLLALALVGVGVSVSIAALPAWVAVLIVALVLVVIIIKGAHVTTVDAIGGVMEELAKVTAERDNAQAEITGLTSKPQPKLRISTGSGPEFTVGTEPAPWGRRFTRRLMVAELAGVLARDVRVRVTRTIPVDQGHGTFPVPLAWSVRDGRAESVDIAPGGREFVVILDIFWHPTNPVVKVASDVLAMPVDRTVIFDVEVLSEHAVCDRRRFWLKDPRDCRLDVLEFPAKLGSEQRAPAGSKAARQFGEDGEVGVQPDPIQTTHAEGK